jgi:hypothetical protein
MAEEAAPSRAPNGQFTQASAPFHGRRGAAERERRFLEQFASSKTRRRQERERLRWAIGVIHHVYGSPRRPRRRPRDEIEMIPLISEAMDVLGEAMDREDDIWSRRLRAVETVFHLYITMPSSKVPFNEGGSFLFGPPSRMRSPVPRSQGV